MPALYTHRSGGLYLRRESRTALSDLQGDDRVAFTLPSGEQAQATVTDLIRTAESYVIYSSVTTALHWARPAWMFASPLRFTRIPCLSALPDPDAGRLTMDSAQDLLALPYTSTVRDALSTLLLAEDDGRLASELTHRLPRSAQNTDAVFGPTWRTELLGAVSVLWSAPPCAALLVTRSASVLTTPERSVPLTPYGHHRLAAPLCSELLDLAFVRQEPRSTEHTFSLTGLVDRLTSQRPASTTIIDLPPQEPA